MAIYLLGTSDTVSLGLFSDIHGTREVSAAVTIRPQIALSGTTLPIFQQWASTGQRTFTLEVSSANTLRFAVYDSANNVRGGQASEVLQMGRLYRVLARWRGVGSRIEIWVNGLRMALSASGTYNVSALGSPATAEMLLGRRTNVTTADGLTADYAEAAVWTRWLSEEECQAYTTGLAPSLMDRNKGVFYWSGASLTAQDEWRHRPLLYTGGTPLSWHPPLVRSAPRHTPLLPGVLDPTRRVYEHSAAPPVTYQMPALFLAL